MSPIEAIAIALGVVGWVALLYFVIFEPIRWHRQTRKLAKGVEVPAGLRRLGE